jgi:hypothetical protein
LKQRITTGVLSVRQAKKGKGVQLQLWQILSCVSRFLFFLLPPGSKNISLIVTPELFVTEQLITVQVTITPSEDASGIKIVLA